MSEPRPEELSDLERALSGLVPHAGELSRDRTMFRAGQASARRGWGWPVAVALPSLAAAVLGWLLFTRPSEHFHTRIVVEVREVPVPSAPSAEPTRVPERLPVADASPAYLRQRQQAERWGVDSLPPTGTSGDASPPAATSVLDLRADMLGPTGF
jgi:hypothetical protein